MRSVWPILFRVAFFLIYTKNLVTCLEFDTYEREREKYGSRMASYINASVDPCENFYEYACGNYFNVNKDEPILRVSGPIYFLIDDLQNAIHEMLTEPLLSKEHQESNKTRNAANVLRIFYQSCMQENIFEYKKSEAYLKLIDSLGGWPVLHPEWKSDNFDWFEAVSVAKGYGINTIFDENSDIIDGFSVLSLEEFGLFPMEKYLKRPYSRAYHKNREVAKHIMMMYGVSKKDAIKAIIEMVDFAINLKISLEFKSLYKPRMVLTLKELENITTTMNWRRFYSNLYDEDKLDTMNITVYDIDNIKNLTEVFKGYDMKIIANYVFLKLLFGLHDELTHSKNKKQFCIRKAKETMYPVMSAMFLESKYYDEDAVDELFALNSYIKGAFTDSIKSAEWLDRTSKKNILKKVDAIQVIIGDNTQTLDMDKYDKQYSGLDISLVNGYHQNYLILKKFEAKHSAKRKPFKFTYMIDASALYNILHNQLILPAGIFRRPFYHPELPKSYNFGVIGFILGHELTHSVDNQAINMWNGEWTNLLTEESDRQFWERIICLIEQYSQYSVVELNRKVEASVTLSDNIADNGGLRHAFYGYKKWLKANQGQLDISKQTLPRLNLTDVQLFFLSYAQTWCSKVRGLEMNKKHIEDVHSPNRWRVIGPLSNFDEFSTAFDCKVGSPMNREKKCILW